MLTNKGKQSKKIIEITKQVTYRYRHNHRKSNFFMINNLFIHIIHFSRFSESNLKRNHAMVHTESIHENISRV